MNSNNLIIDKLQYTSNSIPHLKKLSEFEEKNDE